MILIPGYGGPLKGVLRVNLNNAFFEMIKKGVLMPTCEFIFYLKRLKQLQTAFLLGIWLSDAYYALRQSNLQSNPYRKEYVYIESVFIFKLHNQKRYFEEKYAKCNFHHQLIRQLQKIWEQLMLIKASLLLAILLGIGARNNFRPHELMAWAKSNIYPE